MAYKQTQVRINTNKNLIALINQEARKKEIPVSTYARMCLVDYFKIKGIKLDNNESGQK